MAILNKIRQRSAFLIIIIALALFAFILADLFRSGSFGGNKAQQTIGEVNGEEIKTAEFQSLVDQRKGRGSNMRAVKSIWTNKVNGILINQQAEKAGIEVGAAHRNDLFSKILDNNPTFTDENGAFDMAKVYEYVANVKETDRGRYEGWKNFEESTEKTAAEYIYYDMVKAGVGVSVKEGEIAYKLENDNINFKYVQLPYSSINDDEITVSDSEISTYVNNHKGEFNQEAFTSINYVKIEEKATEADEKAITKEVTDLLNDSVEYNNVTKSNDTIAGLLNTSNVEEFINENSDNKYVNRFQYKSDVPSQIQSTLFEGKVGETFGPYKDKGFIKLSKLVEVAKIPDSVQANQILITWDELGRGATRTKEEAQKLADSLSSVVSADKSKFADLAKDFSEDKVTAEKGGNLGNVNYKRLDEQTANFLFLKSLNSIGVVETQIGFKVLEVTEQKNVQRVVKLATIAKKIEPSEETINATYAQSNDFISKANDEGFKTAVEAFKFQDKSVNKMGVLDENIAGLGQQRAIVKWAFDEDVVVGDIKSFDIPNGYVIAEVTAKEEAGTMSVQAASTKVLPILRNEKKATQLISKISGGDLQSIANANDVKVKSASAVTMENSTISGAGIEKKVVGTAFALNENEVSKPVAGNKGVYVVQVTKKSSGQELPTYSGVAKKLSEEQATQSKTRVLKALEDNAEIEDRRTILY